LAQNADAAKTKPMNLKKPDIVLIILAIALVVGMILTGVIGKGKSKHGYGFIKLLVVVQLEIGEWRLEIRELEQLRC